MYNYFLKTPVYITDEFGVGGSLLILLIGVTIIFIAKFIEDKDIPIISTFCEVFVFKIGIAMSLTGVIGFIISLFQ